MSNGGIANGDGMQRPERGLIGLAERGLIPDALIRFGIRRLCAQRLNHEQRGGAEAQSQRFAALIEELRRSPVAVHVDAANRQHYELPSAFFQHCLGQHLKYSCAYFPDGVDDLDDAEEAMLALYEQRADLADGQDILDLGCGWGSLTLWLAQRHRHSRITAVSNSHGQREHILQRCRVLGLDNVTVLTADVTHLHLPAHRFDRCVSVEMFEHLRNHAALMQRIAGWLRPDGRLFVHVFAHRTLMYPFQTGNTHDWMGRHFFTGGLMPSVDTLAFFQDHLRLSQRWLVDGRHYQRTADAWLRNHDRHRDAAIDILSDAYGAPSARLWNQRWRLFWMACAELFGSHAGQEWLVAHYLFQPRDERPST